MAYKGKKQTTAHAKQLKRVRQFISRAEKRGYRFSDELKNSLKEASTQKLKSYTPKKLYTLATALSETGEVIIGTEARKQERSASAKKSAETRRKRKQQEKDRYYPNGGEIIYVNIVEEFIERLQEPTPQYGVSRRGREFKLPDAYVQEKEQLKTTLLNLTMRVAQEIGFEELGWRLQKQADRVEKLTSIVLYGYGGTIRSAVTELASIINNGALSMSQLQDLGEQEEFNENWESPE